jgi:hypothetical protein
MRFSLTFSWFLHHQSITRANLSMQKSMMIHFLFISETTNFESAWRKRDLDSSENSMRECDNWYKKVWLSEIDETGSRDQHFNSHPSDLRMSWSSSLNSNPSTTFLKNLPWRWASEHPSFRRIPFNMRWRENRFANFNCFRTTHWLKCRCG